MFVEFSELLKAEHFGLQNLKIFYSREEMSGHSNNCFPSAAEYFCTIKQQTCIFGTKTQVQAHECNRENCLFRNIQNGAIRLNTRRCDYILLWCFTLEVLPCGEAFIWRHCRPLFDRSSSSHTYEAGLEVWGGKKKKRRVNNIYERKQMFSCVCIFDKNPVLPT